MPWTSIYQAQFAKPLLNQTIALIQRDQAAALAAINADRAADGNELLTAIAEFHKGPGARSGWPWLYLELLPIQFDHQAGPANYRHSIARMVLDLDCGQFDQEMAQED